MDLGWGVKLGKAYKEKYGIKSRGFLELSGSKKKALQGVID